MGEAPGEMLGERGESVGDTDTVGVKVGVEVCEGLKPRVAN